VRCRDEAASGEVRGVFSTGDSRLPEYLAILWEGEPEEVLLPTDDVLGIEEDAVVLLGSRTAYKDLVAYDSLVNPLLRRLR